MKGFYINLDSRTDRKNHIEDSIKKFHFSKILNDFLLLKIHEVTLVVLCHIYDVYPCYWKKMKNII